MMPALAWLELRQQLRSQVVWIVFTISSLMVGGSLAIDALRVGVTAKQFADGGAAVVRLHLVWTLFHLFTAAALVADAVLRDRATGIAPLIDATPVEPSTYVFGRFAGAFAALVLCFLSVPLVLVVAACLPAAMELLGPVSPSVFAYALFVLALPNLLVGATLFFGLAILTRSMTGCYLGAILLLTLYELSSGSSFPPWLEPFGFLADAHGWGAVIANRLLWIALSILLLGTAGWAHGRRPSGSEVGGPDAAEPEDTRRRPAALPKVIRLHQGPGVQLLVRSRHELLQCVLTPTFAVLLLLGTINAGVQLWEAATAGEAETRLLVRLAENFRLVPVVVAILFAGELVWNERQTGMADLVEATPASGAVLFLSKVVAMAAVMLGMALASGGVVAGLRLSSGATPDWLAIVTNYVLPKTLDWMVFAVLALALQIVSPSKLAGWGFMVLYLILWLGLNQMGLTDPSYRVGGYLGWPVPPELSGLAGAEVQRRYWAVAALGLIAVLSFHVARSRRRGMRYD